MGNLKFSSLAKLYNTVCPLLCFSHSHQDISECAKNICLMLCNFKIKQLSALHCHGIMQYGNYRCIFCGKLGLAESLPLLSPSC